MPKNLLALLALLLSFSACRSTDHRDEGSQVKQSEAASEKSDAPLPAATPAAPEGECAQKPQPVICCEALTPSCNDCRDRAKKEQAAWAAKCVKATEAPKDCASPPVSDCCSDATDACRQCREAAIVTLVDWKDRCAELEAFPCDRKPPQAACCAQAIPSCNGCRDRNRRLMDDWERRCK